MPNHGKEELWTNPPSEIASTGEAVTRYGGVDDRPGSSDQMPGLDTWKEHPGLATIRKFIADLRAAEQTQPIVSPPVTGETNQPSENF